MTARGTAEGPVAIVTGASRGLGAVLARLLAADGYDLLLVARTPEPLAAMARELKSGGTEVRAVAGDVADPGTRRAVVEAIERWGRLDVLLNNASELGPSPLPPMVRVPLEALERIYRVNVVAPVALVQLLEPYLARGRGLVVNVSSDAALGGYPGWGGYGASKAALDLVTRTLAAELRERSVAVVSVDPGDMRTEMHQAAFPGEDISDRPSPESTVPFWAWLLGQPRAEISGQRFRIRADHWGASG